MKQAFEKNNLDWKTYESITKYIYETLGKKFGVKIIGYGNTFKVIGKSGVEHQIDVLTSSSDGIDTSLTAIECKYWNQKVNKDIVMKLAEIIEDSGINKGIIVCKSGFTQDGIQYAKYKNIELVELREFTDEDLSENSKDIHIGNLQIQIKTSIKRTEIIRIDIGENKKLDFIDEFDLFNFFIKQENIAVKSLYSLISVFRNDVNPENENNDILTKRYEFPQGILYNRLTNESFMLNYITFTGQLRKYDENRNMKLTLVDKVWLIMKSIFNERIFSFSENGLIKEHIT